MEKYDKIFEKVWATLDRIGERLEQADAAAAEKWRAEFDKSRAEAEKSRAEAEKLRVEAEKEIKESRIAAEKWRAEFDKEIAESRAAAEKSRAEAEKWRAEFEKSRAEAEKLRVENEKEIKESRIAAEKRRVELDKEIEESRAAAEKSRIEFDRRMKDLSQQIGGMANSNGAFAEEFFYNALQNGHRNMFGEKFDKVWGSTPGREEGFADEYDVVLINGQSVCIVEVKYKADSADFQKLLRKPVTFRENYPKYKNHKMYIALAGMSFHPLTEKACKDNGIAIMKQVGDTMVVIDENLKTF